MLDWRVFSQGGLNSYFTNDPNFNQWPRNETLHFTKLLECTINKTYKMSCPWKHENQHAGMCLMLCSKLSSEIKYFMGHRRRLGLILKRNTNLFSPVGKTPESLKCEVTGTRSTIQFFHNLGVPFNITYSSEETTWFLKVVDLGSPRESKFVHTQKVLNLF